MCSPFVRLSVIWRTDLEVPPVAPHLDPDVYETARMLAPGFDVYYLEREWRSWLPETPRNPEAAFLGFCRKWVQNRKNTG